jgi:hypothetical protein
MIRRLLPAVAILASASLACSIFVGGPEYPTNVAPVSTDSVQSLEDQAKQAVTAGAQTGTITLQITEMQLTSYLAQKLDEQEHPLINEPLVFLHDGLITVYGKATSGVFTANVSFSVQASVDQDGQPKIEVVQSDFGPLPAPQGFNAALSAFVHEAFLGSLGPMAVGFRLEQISVGNGVMTVTGRVK